MVLRSYEMIEHPPDRAGGSVDNDRKASLSLSAAPSG